MSSFHPTGTRPEARAPSMAPKTGINAFLARLRRLLFGGDEPASGAPPKPQDAAAAPTVRRSVSETDDMGFMSLSGTGDRNAPHHGDDVSRLGLVPKNGDADSELARLSLSWEGPAPVAKAEKKH